MVLESSGPIVVDGNVICQSVFLNINPERHQLRCKLAFEKPIDLAIYHYSNSKLTGAGMSVEFNGTEMETTTDFEARVSYSILTRRWKLSGTIGRHSFSKECDCIPELLGLVKEMVMPVYNEPRPKSISTPGELVIKVTRKQFKS